MILTELVIDGFKSYGQRTVICNWDPSFNAITGRNGHGKSNVLDAICFVLGITSPGTLRAQNMNELIYNKGQTGVTKASVTIKFDNSDKERSPPMHKDQAEIVVQRQYSVDGKGKYMINGNKANQDAVHKLFQYTGLNINNPNFLIQQGKVVKVLSMKPKEILAMVEEAAGTSMYEKRRDAASKIMNRKQAKVQELEEIMNEEINPKLEKLRVQKRAWMEFEAIEGNLERLTNLIVAHDYVLYQDRLQKSAEDLDAKKQRARALEKSAERMKGQIECLQEDISRVKAARDKELRKGGRFQELEDDVKSHSHEMVRLATVIDLKKSTMAEDMEKKNTIESNIKALESQLRAKTSMYEQLQERYKVAREDVSKQTEEVEKKEELLQTLQTGVSSKEGQQSGYQGQLQDAQNRASAAATEQEQKKLQISHLEKQIKEEEPKAKAAKQQNSTLLKDLEVLKSQAKRIEAELSRTGYDPERESEMQKQETTLQDRIRELRQQADGLQRKVANMDFSYQDPTPNFDRSRVKGLVAQLFTLDKDHTQAGTALEICAGGRLYNVVVDTAETGTQLLQNGRLKKRVTIIPLNKIAAFRASAEKVGAAQRLAPGKVNLALSLIGYDEEVTAAMDYVFGSTLVCEDAETAKRVTFDPAVRMKSVTWEGDVYDPAGTLSGGSAPQSSGVLVTLQKLNELSKELHKHEKQLSALHGTMSREKKALDTARKLKQELDLKTHEIKLTEEQISGNSSSVIIQRLEEMKNTVRSLKEEIKAAKAAQDEAMKDVKRIERDMKDFHDNKDSKLAELQSSLEKLKKALSKSNASIKPLQAEMREAMVESEQCGADLATAQDQLQDTQTTLQTHQHEIDALVAEQTAAKDTHDIAKANLADEQAKLTAYDDELKALEDTIRSKKELITEEGLEQQRLRHELEKFHKDRDTTAQRFEALKKEHEFVEAHSARFGRDEPDNPFNFHAVDIDTCRAERKQLQERHDGLKTKVNRKVKETIGATEAREASVKNKLKIVKRDKKKIEETVEKLNDYKIKALEKAWSKVNGHFGLIFNELLPGSFAKLEPPEGKTIADGLEIKVQLGKVWKESLNELSGGQRSLAALALILSILQFKPAPLYILDEIDAALDESHTQNIGRLIKTKFNGAQFIIVSLKDGMFDNANRIFRASLVQGISQVEILSKSGRR